MTTPTPLSPADRDALLADYHALVSLMNELELQVYLLGDLPGAERLLPVQQAAGSLIGRMRPFLFRLDQQVLPHLLGDDPGAGGASAPSVSSPAEAAPAPVARRPAPPSA